MTNRVQISKDKMKKKNGIDKNAKKGIKMTVRGKTKTEKRRRRASLFIKINSDGDRREEMIKKPESERKLQL